MRTSLSFSILVAFSSPVQAGNGWKSPCVASGCLPDPIGGEGDAPPSTSPVAEGQCSFITEIVGAGPRRQGEGLGPK